MTKRVLGTLLALTMLALVVPVRATNHVTVKIDGREAIFEVPAQIIRGSTMVPLRAIFEALGASIKWDGSTRTVTATRGSRTVVLQVGAPTATVDGQTIVLAVPAQIVSDRTLVPLRFVAQALGAEVGWDDATRTVSITSPPPPQAAPAVTDVSVRAEHTTVYVGGTTAIAAKAVGTGNMSGEVNWTIASGRGRLSATTGAEVMFIAPDTAESTVVRSTAVDDATKSASVTIETKVGSVKIMDAANLITKAGHFNDLEGKTVRLVPTPEGYAVKTGTLEWNSAQGEQFSIGGRGGPGRRVDLPFAFPFAGTTYQHMYVNLNGNLSFERPERDSWSHRDPYPDGGMLSTSQLIDMRAVNGLERVIAPLWSLWADPTTISYATEADGVTVTWNTSRLELDAPAAPAGLTQFQARLYKSGQIDLSYKKVSERDGIAGIFPGITGAKGVHLERIPAQGSGSHPNVQIEAVDIYDTGSMLKFSFVMKADVPTRVPEKTILEYRVILNDPTAGGCMVRLVTLPDRAIGQSDCVYDPGIELSGRTAGVYVPRSVLKGQVKWKADVVWWGTEHSANLLPDDQRRTLEVPSQSIDLSHADGVFGGNIYEVFHYPAVSKHIEEILPTVYRTFAPDDHIALVFTDFRIDGLYAQGSSRGPYNHRITGIGTEERLRPGSAVGSEKLFASMVTMYAGYPALSESYPPGGGLSKYGRAMGWITHEIVHSWGINLKFRDPETGQIVPLYQNEGNYHWSEWLHSPSVYSVSDEYTRSSYREHTPMWVGNGSYWDELGSDTFVRHPMPYLYPAGLSALDMYVMGLMPPSEVPETFILREPRELAGGRTTARAVPVRIGDIVAAMGTRNPRYEEAQKTFKLGVYLLTESGRPAVPEMVQRVNGIADQFARHMGLISGGRMKVEQ